MSTVGFRIDIDTGGVDVSGESLPMHHNSRPLHRLSEVRQQQGISLRSVARKFGRSVHEIRLEEDKYHDMKISDLIRWQQILDVPLVDLLEDPDASLSDPIYRRARLLRIMKSVKAIEESAQGTNVNRLAIMLINQLTNLMPELANVSPWHSVGQRRTQSDVGKIAEHPIHENFFTDPSV
jgi:transcriptional regulator with XRE-family HTH domain